MRSPVQWTPHNVVNFVKHALHVSKTCHISLTNIHSFVLQTKHFHWSSQYSCLGNCLVWKINMCEKNVHASPLNANGSVVIYDLFGVCTPGATEPVINYSYRTSSRGVRWLARKIFLWPISGEVSQGDSVAILHRMVFLIDRGTCSCLARATWHWGSSEHRSYLNITQ